MSSTSSKKTEITYTPLEQTYMEESKLGLPGLKLKRGSILDTEIEVQLHNYIPCFSRAILSE